MNLVFVKKSKRFCSHDVLCLFFDLKRLLLEQNNNWSALGFSFRIGPKQTTFVFLGFQVVWFFCEDNATALCLCLLLGPCLHQEYPEWDVCVYSALQILVEGSWKNPPKPVHCLIMVPTDSAEEWAEAKLLFTGSVKLGLLNSPAWELEEFLQLQCQAQDICVPGVPLSPSSSSPILLHSHPAGNSICLLLFHPSSLHPCAIIFIGITMNLNVLSSKEHPWKIFLLHANWLLNLLLYFVF